MTELRNPENEPKNLVEAIFDGIEAPIEGLQKNAGGMSAILGLIGIFVSIALLAYFFVPGLHTIAFRLPYPTLIPKIGVGVGAGALLVFSIKLFSE